MPILHFLADAVVHGPIVQDGPLVPFEIRARNGRVAKGYALVDTGTRVTCVNERALHHVGAPAVGTVPRLSMVGGAMSLRLHAANVVLDGVELGEMRLIAVPGLQHVALVGRDVLSRGTYTHDGKHGRFRLEIA